MSRRQLCAVLIVLVWFSFSCLTSLASEKLIDETVYISKGMLYGFRGDFVEGDHLTGSFETSSGRISFWIITEEAYEQFSWNFSSSLPHYGCQNVWQHDVDFIIPSNGTWRLVFDNKYSGDSFGRSVTIKIFKDAANAGADLSPTPLMEWWFWTIVAVLIVVLTGAVYFWKKRKPPTPTAPTPPTEDT